MSKKVEVLIIEDDTNVVHRTVSTVYEDSNTFNVAIQAIVEALTGVKSVTKVQAGAVPLAKVSSKFAEAVPNYVPPVEEPVPQFHPDLVKQGIAPSSVVLENGGIPVVKLDMKTVFKDKK